MSTAKEMGLDASRGDILVDIKDTTTMTDVEVTSINTTATGELPAEPSKRPSFWRRRQLKSKWLPLFNFTIKKHLVPLLSALFLAIAAGILYPVTAIFLGKLFDAFSNFGAEKTTGDQLLERVVNNCIVLLALGAATWVLNGGYFTLWVAFGELQAKCVRELLFEDMLRKDLEWFEMRKDGMGAFLPRLQTQIRELQMATSQPLGFALQDITTSITALVLAFYTSWNLTLVTLAAVPITAVALSFISAGMQPSIAAQQAGLTKASKLANNAIISIDTAKCFNGQTYEVRRYTSAIGEAARYYLRQARANALQIGFVRLTTLGMFVQGFWYGSSLVGSGKASSGDVLTTFWACLMATQSIEQILPQMIVFEKGRAAAVSLKAVLEQLSRRRQAAEPMGTRTPMFCDGDIEVRDVSFAYPSQPDRLALNDCTFFFPAFETTFVVGRSGSGKSTLGNLLMRFYPQTSGDIHIDDLPIEELDINWLRNNITLVQQESVLFNETILKNITFGHGCHGRIDMADIENCIDLAMLRETINDMPDGLDTVVGTGGNALSGGQKQRVAIARARLRDTPILILDESTSALDTSSRTAIMAAIRKWRVAKTTIVITHDMSHINASDFVYILEDGKVTHEGYRETLEKAGDAAPKAFVKPKINTIQESRNSSLGALESGTKRSSYVPVNDDMPKAKVRPSSIYMPSIYTSADQTASQRFPGLSSPFSPLPMSPSFQNHMQPLEPPRALSRYSTGSIEPPSPPPKYCCSSKEFEGFRLERISSLKRSEYTPKKQDKTPLKRISRSIMSERKQSESSQKGQSDVLSLRKIFSTIFPTLAWGNRFLLTLGFFCAFLHAAATPAFSFLFSKLLSTFFLTENRSQMALRWSLCVLGVSIGDGIASFFMHYLLEYCGQAWVDTLRKEAMTRILDQPREWFEREKNKVSNLTTCLDRNAEEMRNLVGRFAGFVFVAIATMLIAVIWCLVLCWKLTMVGLACAPVLYIITRVFEGISGKWESRCNDAGETLASISSETFTYIKTVRALTLESYFHKKHRKAISQAMDTGLKRSCYSGVFFGLSESAILFITALIFYYGAVLASSHEFSIEDILTVFTMLLFSLANVNSVLCFIPQINSSRDTATRLLRLANLPQGTSHEHSGCLRVASPVPIQFVKTNFRYPSRPDSLALQDFSLIIEPNKCTAIVGQSGSGKSTTASLLMSLYQAPLSSDGSPTVLVGGTDIRRLHTPTLRSQIALVPQQPTLFPDTIRANISYGLPTTSPLNRIENIRAAATAAGIDEFITSLPDGYATLIGDGGVGISGGQAQRLSIARALVRHPRMLILDEATSNLDAESAEVIARTVRKVAGRLTVVVITHARRMMEVADRVVVMRGGGCVEEGKFAELVNKKRGELRRMLMDDGDGKGED